jgi:hypothetical protein
MERGNRLCSVISRPSFAWSLFFAARVDTTFEYSLGAIVIIAAESPRQYVFEANRAGQPQANTNRDGRASVADYRVAVDENEAAEATDFQQSQYRSLRNTHLIETECVENRRLRRQPESVLGTVDRFCLSGFLSVIYKRDHLPKQQVVSSDEANQHWF